MSAGSTLEWVYVFEGPSQNPACCAVMGDRKPKALPSKQWSTASLDRGLSMVAAQQAMFQLDDNMNPLDKLAVSWPFSAVCVRIHMQCLRRPF